MSKKLLKPEVPSKKWVFYVKPYYVSGLIAP